jgi:osmotically-inducible protein OsmY
VSYVGRGPKNYRRSDERIEEEINERLERDPQIDATDIEVTVKDGEVTLSGTVENRRVKRLAEDLADDVYGVKDVQNRLRMSTTQGGSPSSNQGI